MALSVVDLYRKVLPRTNCGDCGFSTCLAFASMVVSEKLPLSDCPHLSAEVIRRYQPEIDAQHAAGKWVKKDPAEEALKWARQRASSMRLEDLPSRIGGELKEDERGSFLQIGYLDRILRIRADGIFAVDGSALDRWEQTFIYNHLAQGGRLLPSGVWKSFEELPNTISKIKTMRSNVEAPICRCFAGRVEKVAAVARSVGGKDVAEAFPEAEAAALFTVFPRVPVLLLFWDEEPAEGIEARAKLLFDETVTAHLDIESILFLSEHLRRRMCAQTGVE
ncbi:MAG: DUF3786 domain-containing protein [Desulfobacterales bacterium]|jgi:hypothetical protein